MHPRITMRAFVALAVAVAVGLAFAASPFASPSPDGLERVATDHGFAGAGKPHPASVTAAWRPASRDSPGRSSCSVPHAGSGGRCGGGPAARAARCPRPRALRSDEARAMSGGHALAATGIAGDPASPVHRLDPRAKIVGLLAVTLVAVTTPLGAWPALVACALVLAGVAILARIGADVLWRRGRIVLIPVLFVAAFVPLMGAGGGAGAAGGGVAGAGAAGGGVAGAGAAGGGAAGGGVAGAGAAGGGAAGAGATHDAVVSIGPLTVTEAGLAVLAAVAAKAAIGTCAAVLLGATTSYPDVLRGLRALRVPVLLTTVASLMYRYLHVIAQELRRMRAALAARAFHPRRATDAAPLGRAAAALFLRTHARGERVHLAMLARGFGGTMPELSPLRLTWRDVAGAAGVVALLVAVRVGVAAW
jgi:cobalt/nickel transport system permease protein